MQHLGLISILILILGLAAVVYKRPGGLDVTFSQRVANNLRAEMPYSLLFIITLPLLYLFFTHWFVPAYDIADIFMWLALVAATFQVACTWVPERGGTMTTVHRILTGISGIALLPMLSIIASTRTVALELRYLAWFGVAFMSGLLIIALAHQKGYRYALLLQIGYYTVFFAIVLLVTYQ